MRSTPLAHDFSLALSAHHETPCLSLYQPTHRHHPGNQQDPLRFRHLVKELRQSLATRFPQSQVLSILEPFEELALDREFWNHTLDGIAVFGAPGLFQAYRLQRPVPELAVVADSFHTRPLSRLLQSVDRFQVLGLSLHEIRLFEGSRDALDEINLAPDVPRTITEALGLELTEPHQTVAAYGGISQGSSMRHGQGGRKDEADIDADRFFRAVDRAILKHHSSPSKLPLLLAALPEHHSLFRRVSHNPFLLDEGIALNPMSIPAEEMRAKAWQTFEPRYRADLMELANSFTTARSKGLGLDDLHEITTAALAGRISSLLVEADRQIPGQMDAATGSLKLTDPSHPEVGDVLDDLGELVVLNGGRVVVIPSDQMPTASGAAATCRF